MRVKRYAADMPVVLISIKWLMSVDNLLTICPLCLLLGLTVCLVVFRLVDDRVVVEPDAGTLGNPPTKHRGNNIIFVNQMNEKRISRLAKMIQWSERLRWWVYELVDVSSNWQYPQFDQGRVLLNLQNLPNFENRKLPKTESMIFKNTPKFLLASPPNPFAECILANRKSLKSLGNLLLLMTGGVGELQNLPFSEECFRKTHISEKRRIPKKELV